MARKLTRCVEKPAQCPYCGGGRIWYHGWYHRKGGGIPRGDSGVCGPLAIRRFKCRDCRRTFSWRPAFLVFGHHFAAAAYEPFLQDEARRGGEWWQPGAAAVLAVRKRLRRMAASLTERLESHLGHPPSGRADVPEVLRLAHEVAAQQALPDHPRLSCHVLFLALARTRSHASYSLTAA